MSLREKVARAICEVHSGPCKCYPDECGCVYFDKHADAAIALVLEEVENGINKLQAYDHEIFDSMIESKDGSWLKTDDVYSAIRALAKHE